MCDFLQVPKNLDDLLDGGIEAGVITQIYGGPGSGKTQICYTLCVMSPSIYGVIYIDTEGSFRPERIKAIAKARGLDPKQILQKIRVAKALDSNTQESCIEAACSAHSLRRVIILLSKDSMSCLISSLLKLLMSDDSAFFNSVKANTKSVNCITKLFSCSIGFSIHAFNATSEILSLHLFIFYTILNVLLNVFCLYFIRMVGTASYDQHFYKIEMAMFYKIDAHTLQIISIESQRIKIVSQVIQLLLFIL
ncbi:MAG: ATPase domain-containing protein [Candidatus Nitrosopolaris sp.]